MKNSRVKKVKGSFKIRKTWEIHPATRIKDSDKIYDRNAEKHIKLQDLEDYNIGDMGDYD